MSKIISLFFLLALSLGFAGCVSTSAPASTDTKVTTDAQTTAAVPVSTDDSKINAIFPRTPVLDGSFDEPSWKDADWQGVSLKLGNPVESPDDSDFKVAVIADAGNLYAGFQVTDDIIKSGEDTLANVYNDDSVEIYLDPNFSRGTNYDKDDAQITIGADNIGGDPTKLLLGGKGTIGLTVNAVCVKTDKGWNAEVQIPLKNDRWKFEYKNGTSIGFAADYNDDDDGKTRDHKLKWSKLDKNDQAWQQSKLFGILTFVEKK